MGWRGFRQLLVPFAEEKPRSEVDFVVFLFLDPQLAAMNACYSVSYGLVVALDGDTQFSLY